MKPSYNTAVSIPEQAVTPAGAIIEAEIRARGPMRFSRFMEIALYDERHGYYRGARDPFGKHGDFYTAEQMQPVFGIVMRDYMRGLRRRLGEGEFRVVEMGAGRGEMAGYFEEFGYSAVDVARGQAPERFRGAIFANEFFDALPVDVYRHRNGAWYPMLVQCGERGFEWVESRDACAQAAAHLASSGGEAADGDIREVSWRAAAWMRDFAERLEEGFVVAIDYGYTAREAVRFPNGTLLSYRRHRAIDNVLDNAGMQDITAHVDFTALENAARECGFERVSFERMGLAMLSVGEADGFAEALRASNAVESARRKLQLKSLLYEMGETFRVLLLQKARTK